MRPLALVLALHTGPPPVDVTWQADASCPVERFHARLAAYLEGAGQQRSVRVTAEIRHDRRWTADLVVTSADGRTERQLAGNACDEVVDAAAFVTAVVVDPGVLARPPPAETDAPLPAPTPEPVVPAPTPAVVPDPPPQDPPVPTSPPPSDPAPDPPPRRPRPGGFLRVSGGLEGYALPRVGPTAALTVGLLGRRWRLELGGTYRGPTRAPPSSVDPDVYARVSLWAVALRGCGVLRPSVLEIPLCGGLEAGQAMGEGVGYDAARRKSAAWVAALVGPAIAWAPRRWLALWLGVELGVPLSRGVFESEGLPDLYVIRPVSLRAGFGLELRFF